MMSWYVEVKAFPKEAHLPSRECFLALISDHLKDHIVALPCMLLQGDFKGAASRYAISYRGVEQFMAPVQAGSVLKPNVHILALCAHEEALAQALQEAPYGEQDLYVLFQSLDRSNELVRRWVFAEYPDYREVQAVGFYALAQPQEALVVLPGARDFDGHVIDEDTLEEMRRQNTLPDRLWANSVWCTLQWFFSLGAERGPVTFPPEIRTMFARHFGDDLLIGTNED